MQVTRTSSWVVVVVGVLDVLLLLDADVPCNYFFLGLRSFCLKGRNLEYSFWAQAYCNFNQEILNTCIKICIHMCVYVHACVINIIVYTYEIHTHTHTYVAHIYVFTYWAVKWRAGAGGTMVCLSFLLIFCCSAMYRLSIGMSVCMYVCR